MITPLLLCVAAVLLFTALMLKIELVIRCDDGAVSRSFGIGSRELHRSSRRHPRTEKKDKPPECHRELQYAKLRAGYAALCRILGMVVVDKLRIRFVAALPDPAEAAALYGVAGLALEELERIGTVRERDLCVTIDFDRAEPGGDGEIVLYLRVFQMAYLQFFYMYQLAAQVKRSERSNSECQSIQSRK